jgi:hypothetical protein
MRPFLCHLLDWSTASGYRDSGGSFSILKLDAFSTAKHVDYPNASLVLLITAFGFSTWTRTRRENRKRKIYGDRQTSVQCGW